MKIQVKRRTQLQQLAAVFRPDMQADLASALSRQAAEQLPTRAPERCSGTIRKYACHCLIDVFPDLASQL